MADLTTAIGELLGSLRESFPEVEPEKIDVASGLEMDVVTVPPQALTAVLERIRDELGFDMLVDISAVDWLPREPRYEVNYHLLSMRTLERVRVKVPLPDVDAPEIPSITALWPGANWHEREVFDFFGVVFTGHPDLKRILMPDEWVGYPLRKDYPVGGVPVEFRIEPAYVGDNVVPADARPSAGGVPARLRRDRGRLSHWTWTGAPAAGVKPREVIEGHEFSEEGKEE